MSDGGSIREVMEAAYVRAGGEADAPATGTGTTDGTPTSDVNGAPSVSLESTTATPPPTDLDSASSSIDKPGRVRDANGRFVTKTSRPGETVQSTTTPPPPSQKADGPPGGVRQEGASPSSGTEPPAPELRAPQSWKPNAREKWAALPREVQEEALRIDKEVRQTLQETAPLRKFAQEVQAAAAPFEAMVRAEGSTIPQAIGSLFQTAAALRTAPPAHKAQLVAQLVKQFGIPVDALDAALAGEAPPNSQSHSVDPTTIARQVEQQIMQRLEQQRIQAASHRSTQDISSFGQGHEFLEDVREDMADIIEARARRGIALSMEDAYSWAINLPHHKEIQEVLKQREQAKHAQNAQASTDKARLAASSVKGQPAAPMKNGAPRTTREAIERAYEEVASR